MTYIGILKIGISIITAITVFFSPLTANEETIQQAPPVEQVLEQVVEPIEPVVEPVVETRTVISTRDCSEYRGEIESYDWSVDIAMKICKAESQGNPQAINWTDKHYDIDGNLICVSSQGLFQIACFHPENLGYEYEDLLDPVKNIEMAYKIWESSGWKPWTTYQQIIALAK